MKTLLAVFASMVVLWSNTTVSAEGGRKPKNGDIVLTNWELKSTVLEKEGGKAISTGHYTPENWYRAEVPTTVLNALVKDGVYPNPRLDMNNYKIPDVSDRFNNEFGLAEYSYLPNHVNPWKDPYWFRTEFVIPGSERGKQVWLHFDGINYRAEVWLNGDLIADSSEVVGMFKRYKFNVTNAVRMSGENHLAVKIYQVDNPGMPGSQLKVFGNSRGPDVSLFKDETLKISGGWDCALTARDRDMGIYRNVYLSFSGEVEIIHPYVVSTLPLPDTSCARLGITTTLVNVAGVRETGVLKGTITLMSNVNMGDYVKHYPAKMIPVTFEKKVDVPANGDTTVTLSYRDFPQLKIDNPHLWWPNGCGQQYLHNLELSYETGGKTSDVRNTMFGIREVTSSLQELNGQYGRVFSVNGRKVFCKGGWIQPDMLLNNSKQNIYDQVRLIANANLNLVSSEDMPAPSRYLMDALDKYGIMWWEVFYQCWVAIPGTAQAYFPLDHYLAVQSTKDIILRYRNDPSLIAWCAANETLPGPDLYFALKSQLERLDTTRVFLASTGIWWNWEKYSRYVKPDLPVGTTDDGTPDYTWYPLPYYFNKIDAARDNMFHNELGMDAVPPLSSLKKFIFNLHVNERSPVFPLDSVWAEHGAWDGGGYAFKAYYYAIKKLYGFRNGSVDDFCRAAQLVNADNYRAMFEAANSRVWDITSGVMIWKLNASYPDFAWETYDWFLNPNAGYYYVKSACEPLHVQMDANDHEVSLVNNYDRPVDDLRVRARVYDFNMRVRWQRQVELSLRANGYQDVFSIPQLSRMTPVYFVRLQLINRDGKVLSSNLYWEQSKTIPGWSRISSLSDVREAEERLDSSPAPAFYNLAELENVKLDLTYKVEKEEQQYHVYVKVKNPTNKLSIMNRLAIIKKSDKEEVLPTFWSDNFVCLFPGQEKTLEATFAKRNLDGSSFLVVVNENK